MTDHGREVRSPSSLTKDQPHPRRGELKQGGPFRDDSASKRRADQTHPVPVQGAAPGVLQDRGRRG
jgi:hypothetical protein